MTAVPRVTARGWMRQLRDGLSDQQALTVVGVVAVIIASVIAQLAIGDKALHVVLVAVVVWLMWDRLTLLDRCDQATDTADRALALVYGDDKPTGRHARQTTRTHAGHHQGEP